MNKYNPRGLPHLHVQQLSHGSHRRRQANKRGTQSWLRAGNTAATNESAMLCLGSFVAQRRTRLCGVCLLETEPLVVSLGARCCCIPKSEPFPAPPSTVAGSSPSPSAATVRMSQPGFRKTSFTVKKGLKSSACKC